MTAKLRCVFSGFNENTSTLTIPDQLSTNDLLFRVVNTAVPVPDEYYESYIVSSVTFNPASVPVGMTVTVSTDKKISFALTPVHPLGNTDYPAFVEVNYYEASDPYTILTLTADVHVQSLVRKIYYYDNNLGGKLVKYWLAPEYVSFKNAWVTGTVYNTDDTVTYGGFTWFALKGIYGLDVDPSSPINTPPTESAYWTKFPYDNDNFHVRAACSSSNTTKLSSIWGKVFFSTSIDGKLLNPVFYENGSKPVSSDPTGKLVGSGTVFVTTNLEGGFYEANVSDTSIGDHQFYLSFSYASPDPTDPTNPAKYRYPNPRPAMPPLTIVKEITSTFTSNGSPVSSPVTLRAGATEPAYPLEVNVNNHILTLPAGTNYANLVYRVGSDFGAGGFNDFSPITTTTTAPIYIVPGSVNNTFANPVGKTSCQLRFNTRGTYYVIGRPTGDLNQTSSTLGLTTNALRIVVEPSISTAFTLTNVTPPITGFIDVPINMSAVSPGNLRWTLHPFNGVAPTVFLCSKNNSTGVVTKLFPLGTNTTIDQEADFVYPVTNISYLLRVEANTPTSQTYNGILTLKNRDYATSSDTTANFSFARPSATFVVTPSTITIQQFGTGTITGSYNGLVSAVTDIIPNGGSGTLTFGPATFSGGTTGTFTVPITNATTENVSGYSVLVKAQNGGVDIAGASATAIVKVTATAGKPTVGIYNSGTEYPILCQTQASDTNPNVVGGWHANVTKTDPTTSLRNLVNKAYLTLRDVNTNPTKAGLYTISASLDGVTGWTPVLNPGALDSDESTNNYSFITIARHNNDSYPLSVTIRSGVAVTAPYIYLRASISGIDSTAFKITFIPNIQIVAGTQTSSLSANTAKIENNAGALFVVNTAYDGWSTETITRFGTPNSLYMGFPNVSGFLKDETWVLQRNGVKSGSATKYNLFFETNSYTGPNYFFVVFKYPDGTIFNIYRAELTIATKGSLNLRTAAGGTTATAAIGDVVSFNVVNVDSQRLYTYSQNASDATSWTIATPPSTTRNHTIGSTDGFVYIAASYGDLLGAIKYTIVGQGCTLVATSSFLDTFILPTASENYYYPAGAPSTAGGLKLPSKVQVITASGGTPVDKTVKTDGTGWQFLSASYSSTALEILPLFQSMRLDAAHPTAFNFQITRSGTGTDYRLGLPSGLNVGGMPISGASTLTIVFKANFDGGLCATISRDIPVRQFTYTTDSPVTSEACNYFPPSSGGSQQYTLPSGYSSLEEVIANNISITNTDFTSKYGLSVFSDKITTLALTTPLESATLSDSYYGFSDLNYTIYVVVGNSTSAKKIVPLAYYKQYTAPNYLPYPQKVGLTATPTGTSLTCYNGDKVYISLLTTISSAFNFTNYDLVFITGTTIVPQSIASYDSTNKVLSFDVTPGVFVTGTSYTLGVRHKTTDCVYFGTPAITFICGGPRPSGPMEITQPAEQEPCTPSISVNAKSSTGTDISAITRVQVYKTSAGTVANNFTGDVSVWDNVTPSIGSTKTNLSFLLNNSTKEFSSLITSKKQQNYFVSFYTGSASGGYVPFAQGVSLALVLKNPVLRGAETNKNRTPVLTSPVPTLYENTLSVTCSSCKDGSCADTNLASLTTIDWADSLSAQLPAWLDLLPGPTENSAILSGSPTTTTEDSFTITVSVPYYVDGNGAPFIHTYDFPITLSPTTAFTIDTDVSLKTKHYQDSYSHTFTVNGKPSVDCASLTWSIIDRELAGADKALPPSTLASPITLSNGVFTWLDVDDPDASYPVKYVFAVQAVCTGGTTATGVVTLNVDPRNPVVSGVVPDYGYFDVTNDIVTITGLDFYPGEVRFGNEKATSIFVNVTNDALTCTPPTRADIGGDDLPVDVIVYNSDGGVSQSGIKYTYQRKKNPIITDIIPSGGTFRGGTKVAIIGANFEPTSTVIIDGVLQPLLSVTPTAIIFVTMPHSVGQASVEVTNSIPPVSTTTYYFAAEPRVSDVQPYNISADGGIDVYIIGTDFQPGVRIFLDDYEIPADRITVL